MKTINAVTMYTVVKKPILSEGQFYTLDKVETLCYTQFKLWAWIVFLRAGWTMPKDHSIQIITLRPGE